VSSLADVQAGVHRVVTGGESGAGAPLPGGPRPAARLAIHRRHHEASLVTALVEKFPATAWLVGSEAVLRAARAFVTTHPPLRPCIAEYGAGFPLFLHAFATAATRLYLWPFAELEWCVGRASLAIDRPPLDWSRLVDAGAALQDYVLVMQPGTHYLHAPCAVDDLMKLYLSDSAPAQLTMSGDEARIEVRGARGDVRFARLDEPTFLFRAALHAGHPLGEAAEYALACDPRFDLARALSDLVSGGAVIDLVPLPGESS